MISISYFCLRVIFTALFALDFFTLETFAGFL